MLKDAGIAKRIPVKRNAILAAARKVFLRDGYQASLDTIAEVAGVARRTVFYQFGSKEQLLREIVDAMTADAAPKLTLDAEADIGATLLQFARSYVAAVTSAETLMLYRIIVFGAPNLLAKMRTTVERNTTLIATQLARYFEGQIAAGRVRKINVDYAAEQFLSAILGFARIEIMMGIKPKMHQRDSYVEATVNSFLDGVRAGHRNDGL